MSTSASAASAFTLNAATAAAALATVAAAASATFVAVSCTSVATGTAALRPIVGGSGDYGGAAGQVSSEEMPSGLWKKSARFWR